MRKLRLVAMMSLLFAAPLAGQEPPIVIRAGMLLDGKGGAQRGLDIVVQGSKIVKIASQMGTPTYDLRTLTILPGLIDTHIHISYHFGQDGRASNRDETPAQEAYYTAENAYATLMAGFTTVQSVGAAADVPLREAISRGTLPGPRILTSIRTLNENSGTPDQLRELVRKLKTEGADVVKIFASKSIRDGGAQTMTDEQLLAVCGEAKAKGLRTLVHAHAAGAIKAAVRAGCGQIEHGVFVDDEALGLMAERGVYFDPNIGLVIQNYLRNKSRFLGIGNYTEEGFAQMEKAVGMENASNIFLAEDAFNEHLNAHEIAHQWFGDSVTEADWHHLWLSEGFATYFAHLFAERFEGRDKFVQLMLKDKEDYLKEYAKDPRPIYDPAITDLMKLLNANNYQKGGWVLHMLRRVLGDEKFFAGIRDYYRTYRDRNALTEDLQRVMEFHYGQPLGWFFKQWIYQPGYPQLDAVWRWNESVKELMLRVEQTQAQTVFRLPLEVEFKFDKAAQRETISLSERSQSFTFKLAAKPRSLALDPDEWVLKVLRLRAEE